MNSQVNAKKTFYSPLALYKAKFCNTCADRDYCNTNLDRMKNCMLAALLDVVYLATGADKEMQR